MIEEVHEEDDSEVTENALLSSGESVLMQTAKTNVKNPRNDLNRNIRLLLDPGSQRTYITENLAKALGLKLGEVNDITLVTFGSKHPQKIKSPTTTIDITLKDGSLLTITANVIPGITGSTFRGPVHIGSLKDNEHLLSQYTLADTIQYQRESSSIDLLVDNDHYLDLMLSQKVEIMPGLYLLESKLGWILSGRTSELSGKNPEFNMLVLTYGLDIGKETNLYTNVDRSLPVKANLDDFWNLETIGIQDSPVDHQDSEAMKSFHETLQYQDGRYYVSWPWKDELTGLPGFNPGKSCI